MKIRNINLTDWELSGQGNTAKSYFNKNDKSVMLKLFTGLITDTSYAKKEYEFSKNVEELGIETPKALEFVNCDGKSAIIYERILNKKSYSKLCADNPEHISEYAKDFAEETYKLHQIKCNTKFFPSRSKRLIEIANEYEKFTKITKDKILEIVNYFGDTDTCLHGDLQTGNLIIANDKKYWIDLSHFAYGHPMYDLSCMYFFFVTKIGRILARSSVHMNGRQLDQFWEAFSNRYIELSNYDKEKFYNEVKACLLIYFVFTTDLEKYEGIARKIIDFAINYLAKRTVI